MDSQLGGVRSGCGVIVRCRECAPDALGTCERCDVMGWSEGSGGIVRLDVQERQALAALFAAGLVPLAYRTRPSREAALAGV